jgi:hypothetical protein
MLGGVSIQGPLPHAIYPVLDAQRLLWPLEARAFHEPGGMIVGIAARQREMPPDIVLRPAGLGGDDRDVGRAPDRPC